MGDQPEPVHGHENTVDAGEGQPEMKFAERFVQAAAKKFREPEKECAENGECRSDAHDEVEMAGDEIVADGGSGGEIVARQEKSGKAAREKKRNEKERERHSRRPRQAGWKQNSPRGKSAYPLGDRRASKHRPQGEC